MKPAPLERRIIDAMVDKLEELSLPEHYTIRYKRPRAVPPQFTPMLNVFALQKAYVAQTTVYYDNAIAIGISWRESVVDAAELIAIPDEMLISQLEAITDIEGEVFRWSIDGLDVERVELEDGREQDVVYAVYPVGIDLDDPPQVDEGLVQGYAMTVEVDATQTKPRERR